MMDIYSGPRSDPTAVFCGRLEVVRNDEVHEVINGKYELTFQYPVSGIHFNSLLPGRHISAPPNAVDPEQLFTIYRIAKPINGWITVYAQHISRWLHKCVCRPFTAENAQTAVQRLELADVGGSMFHFSTDIDAEGEMGFSLPTITADLMGSGDGCILSVYGGEWEYDGFQVRLLAQRGKDQGVRIDYGWNMTGYQSDTQRQDMLDAIYAYYLDQDGNFAEGVTVTAEASAGEEGLTIEPRDYTDQMDRKDLVLQLLTPVQKLQRLAEEELIRIGVFNDGADKSFRVSFVQLSKTEEYAGLAINDGIGMGDTIHVSHAFYGETAGLRATEIRYQPSTGRYKEVTLGRPSQSIIKTILKK